MRRKTFFRTNAVLVTILLLSLIFAWQTSAQEAVSAPMHRIQVFDAEEVAASANASGPTAPNAYIDFSDYNGVMGNFSLQYTITGDGTCKFEYLMSNDNTNYLEPSTADDIGSGLTKTSGPASDGKDILYFNPEIADRMKIKVTETGGANSVTVTAWLVFQ